MGFDISGLLILQVPNPLLEFFIGIREQGQFCDALGVDRSLRIPVR